MVIVGDVRRRELMLRPQRQQSLHRRLRRDVARKRLEGDGQRFPAFAQARGDERSVAVAGIDVEHAELAFEDDLGALETARREIRRRHAALRGAAHVDAFHHAALAGFHERQ